MAASVRRLGRRSQTRRGPRAGAFAASSATSAGPIDGWEGGQWTRGGRGGGLAAGM
uniref:Uncharacterized protein n=1 Tax=Oryza sativa subsp. japonica TaxID=39947 RepID=Q5Z618_ORYSJ|nr:hypothetical protein [Oryza sativa Japonica Group]BAD61941.1 hypothetical protein [Oryza sativa Japonica Group]